MQDTERPDFCNPVSPTEYSRDVSPDISSFVGDWTGSGGGATFRSNITKRLEEARRRCDDYWEGGKEGIREYQNLNFFHRPPLSRSGDKQERQHSNESQYN